MLLEHRYTCHLGDLGALGVYGAFRNGVGNDVMSELSLMVSEASQRKKGRSNSLIEFHKNLNSETLKNISFLDKTILNIFTSADN